MTDTKAINMALNPNIDPDNFFKFVPGSGPGTFQLRSTHGIYHFGDLTLGDDGYYAWYPLEAMSGYYSEFFLQVLLIKIRELNAGEEAQIQRDLYEPV